MSENKIRLKNQKPNSTNSTSLGPVSDLENFVEKEWWNHIFNSFYLKTDGVTSLEVYLITQILNLRPDQKILYLYCGQGRHSLDI